jgi:hypothetical protein
MKAKIIIDTFLKFHKQKLVSPPTYKGSKEAADRLVKHSKKCFKVQYPNL